MPSNKKTFRQHIIDSSPLAIITMDQNFKITSFNKQAEQITGYLANEALGESCQEILHSSFCKEKCPPQKALSSKKSIHGLEGELVNRSGKNIPVRISVSVLEDVDNNFLGYMEVIEDISREKKIERERINFISSIIHDMKSPLICISGLVKRLNKNDIFKNDKKIKNYLRVIYEAEKQLESMVNDFLEYSRLASNRLQLKLNNIDIEDVLVRAAKMQQPKADKQNINVSIDCHFLSIIKADEKQLHRVFSNLIDNAIKYSPKDAEITITARETEDEIIINFQDKGWGIKPEEIPYIFDAFYREKAKEIESGYGLGLAASKAIIKRHGGKISVKSTPGKGSLFTVKIPKQKTSPPPKK